MAKLKHTFKTDILFKLLFIRHPDLLERLVANLMGLPVGSIADFRITNPEILPNVLDGKFCKLDINMLVDGKQVNLEIQVRKENAYPERALYYATKMYSASLLGGDDYREIPATVTINILAFPLFDCKEYHSKFQVLETTRGERLTDKLTLHFFELSKLPKEIDGENELFLWLLLFKAETEEDLSKIKALEVPVMEQAMRAYEQITATDEFRELERLREKAAHDETAALNYARLEERKVWEDIVADMGAELERLRAELGKRSGG